MLTPTTTANDISLPSEPAVALTGKLLAMGCIDAPTLERASRVCEKGKEPLHLGLVKLGLVGEREMAEALASCLNLPLAQKIDYPETPLPTIRVSTSFLQRARLLPLRIVGNELEVAAADPLDAYAIRALEVATELGIRLAVGVPADIEAALAQLYEGGGEHRLDDIAETVEEASSGSHDEDIERLRDLASEAPVIRLVNLLITRAVENRASDIHLETFRSRLKVRYRIDGEMLEIESPPAHLRPAIISRVKIMAKLDIAERRLPQDGRIKLAVRGKEIDFRVSVLPTMHGESIVLRILDRGGLKLDFSVLGFDENDLANWCSALDVPNGVLLVTGPTGSGKTSTLYASMVELSSPKRKVVTVEDPIEYELDGVNQIQTRSQIGLDFATILRSILRHDPDVIMIGEIRDHETAAIAVQAALTGHLVLSTLHTNNAASAVTRLLDMGIEDYLLTSTLNAVGAQRLVRRLCPDCKEAYVPLPELVEQLGLEAMLAVAGGRFYRSRGCMHCAHTGYHGRIAIIEVMTMSDGLRRRILKRAAAGELHQAAVAEGMRTMYHDGLKKVAQGITSLDEVLRVARAG